VTTTASQTIIARVAGRKRENIALVIMAIGAAALAAAIALDAMHPPRTLQDPAMSGITPQ